MAFTKEEYGTEENAEVAQAIYVCAVSDEDIINDTRTWLRHAVAQSKSCNRDVLEKLANDPEACVRIAAKGNPNYKDKDEYTFDDIL